MRRNRCDSPRRRPSAKNIMGNARRQKQERRHLRRRPHNITTHARESAQNHTRSRAVDFVVLLFSVRILECHTGTQDQSFNIKNSNGRSKYSTVPYQSTVLYIAVVICLKARLYPRLPAVFLRSLKLFKSSVQDKKGSSAMAGVLGKLEPPPFSVVIILLVFLLSLLPNSYGSDEVCLSARYDSNTESLGLFTFFFGYFSFRWCTPTKVVLLSTLSRFSTASAEV
jgi:hypothetical protein